MVSICSFVSINLNNHICTVPVYNVYLDLTLGVKINVFNMRGNEAVQTNVVSLCVVSATVIRLFSVPGTRAIDSEKLSCSPCDSHHCSHTLTD